MAQSITSPRTRKQSRRTGVNGDTRPDKPYAGYPLQVHPAGRISRTVRGRVRYFGH